MTARQLIKRLKTFDPDKEVVILNRMGCPAYDYEGQTFRLGTDKRSSAITILSEIDKSDDE